MSRHALIASVLAVSLAVLLTPRISRADVITQWTFNTNPSDGAANTGTTDAETGLTLGSIAALNTSGTFAQGSNSDTSATANDGNNNSSLNTSPYPGPSSGNLTTGIEVDVNTTGYQDIVLTFDHNHAPGASRRFRIQFSSDGTSYSDGDFYTASSSNAFLPQGQDFSALPALDNNPNVSFRIVAEFEGSFYSGTTDNYAAGAFNRFDLVTISGTPIPEPAATTALLTLLGLTLHRRR